MIHLSVPTVHLYQESRDDLLPARSWMEPIRILRLSSGSASQMEVLYREVGERWRWSSRREWGAANWAMWTARSAHEVWVAEWRDNCVGFAELIAYPNLGEVEIKYLGLLPQFIGWGLGGGLVTEVAKAAWSMGYRTPFSRQISRVRLCTSLLDARGALPNYLARGFRLGGSRLSVRRLQDCRSTSPANAVVWQGSERWPGSESARSAVLLDTWSTDAGWRRAHDVDSFWRDVGRRSAAGSSASNDVYTRSSGPILL